MHMSASRLMLTVAAAVVAAGIGWSVFVAAVADVYSPVSTPAQRTRRRFAAKLPIVGTVVLPPLFDVLLWACCALPCENSFAFYNCTRGPVGGDRLPIPCSCPALSSWQRRAVATRFPFCFCFYICFYCCCCCCCYSAVVGLLRIFIIVLQWPFGRVAISRHRHRHRHRNCLEGVV